VEGFAAEGVAGGDAIDERTGGEPLLLFIGDVNGDVTPLIGAANDDDELVAVVVVDEPVVVAVVDVVVLAPSLRS
jgi:hypothetical protein